MVNIRNNSSFSYIHFWPGFAILRFISRVVTGVNNTKTNIYSLCKVLLIFRKGIIIP